MTEFLPYPVLNRAMGIIDEGNEVVLLTDQFSASDYALMIKTAIRAVEILSERVAELEKMSGKIDLPDLRGRIKMGRAVV